MCEKNVFQGYTRVIVTMLMIMSCQHFMIMSCQQNLVMSLLIPWVTIVTVKKYFSYKALNLFLYGVSMYYQQTVKLYNVSMRRVQFNVNCHMTRAAYLLVAP